MSRFVARRPRKSWRTSASAISVPRIVATIVDSKAMTRLMRDRALQAGRRRAVFSQASSEKPCQTKLHLPAGSLKLNRAMTATGSIR